MKRCWNAAHVGGGSSQSKVCTVVQTQTRLQSTLEPFPLLLNIFPHDWPQWGGERKKREQCLTGRGERRRAPSQSSSHGNQAGERAFETRKQKDDKVQPLSSAFLLISAPSPPPTLLRFVQRGLKKKKKKNKMEKDIKDISDDRWGGITKEKTSRDGSSSTKQNAKMQKKKKRC